MRNLSPRKRIFRNRYLFFKHGKIKTALAMTKNMDLNANQIVRDRQLV
jgi:hypothetical protein